MISAFLALYWPELAGVFLILAAVWFVVWAFDGDVVAALLFGVPFGWGVGMGVVEIERRRAG